MKKFFKILGISLLLVVAFFVPVIIAVLIGATPMAGVLFSLACLSIVLLFLIVRSIWIRRREKKFINGILEQDREDADQYDKQVSEELSQRWKEAVSSLKKSNLRYHGNPLYVLPWYMIIGESGSGKTTAIHNSGLSSKFGPAPKVSGVSGTRNCDWWFFEHAIFIDTAGRYAIHPDETTDRDEWRLFLSKLAKYRKKEPLNGLIISVSAENLLSSTPDKIEDEGQRIRIRIEELMQSLGAKFPVYVMVTKCDLIHGMREFCEFLPQRAQNQALGYLNKEDNRDALQVVDETFQILDESMGEYRLRFSGTTGSGEVPPEALLFPEEFSILKSGLSRFVQTAFDKTVYKEEPHLRGIYFSSAIQAGLPYSHFTEHAPHSGANAKRQTTEKSYFLYDFFSKILPSDRKIYTLTQRARQWKNRLKVIKIAAWGTLTLTICGFLTWSFAINLSTINQFKKEYSGIPTLSGELLKDINTLEDFKKTALNIQHKNEQIWLPNFGLNHCENIEKKLKDKYCKLFKQDFMMPYDKKSTEEIVNYSSDTPNTVLAKFFPHYIKRINLLQASLKINKPAELRKKPFPEFKYLVSRDKQDIISKYFELMKNQYLYYLLWADKKMKKKELQRLHSKLEFLATKENISMQWLIAWYNEKRDASLLRLEDFWQTNDSPKDAEIIEPAYTAKGLKNIDEMLSRMENALQTPLKIEKKKNRFKQWYKKTYINQWYEFAKAFDRGRERLERPNMKQKIAKMIAAKNGPYFSFLKKMSQELQPFADRNKATPSRVELVQVYDKIKKYALTDSSSDNTGLIKDFARKGLRIFGGTTGRAARKAGDNISLDGDSKSLMSAAKGYNKYVQSLKKLSNATASAHSSYKLASSVFDQDPATSKAAVYKAERGLEDIRSVLWEHEAPQEVFFKLIKGPFNFLWDYVCSNTGCYIQKKWDEKVLSQVEGVYEQKVKLDMLFGDQGYVNKFQSDHIDPFISRSSSKGYYPKEVAGNKIPFSSRFFTYLTKGSFSAQSKKSEYEVELEGAPTEANPGAKISPYATRLELECTEGTQALKNYNYPESKTFTWSPESCGDVTLKILVADRTLVKEYTGFRPFAKFLKDFSKGRHTYPISQFEEQANALKRRGIKYIRVKYKISGARPVIRLLNMSPGDPPKVIVPCSN